MDGRELRGERLGLGGRGGARRLDARDLVARLGQEPGQLGRLGVQGVPVLHGCAQVLFEGCAALFRGLLLALQLLRRGLCGRELGGQAGKPLVRALGVRACRGGSLFGRIQRRAQALRLALGGADLRAQGLHAAAAFVEAGAQARDLALEARARAGQLDDLVPGRAELALQALGHGLIGRARLGQVFDLVAGGQDLLLELGGLDLELDPRELRGLQLAARGRQGHGQAGDLILGRLQGSRASPRIGTRAGLRGARAGRGQRGIERVDLFPQLEIASLGLGETLAERADVGEAGLQGLDLAPRVRKIRAQERRIRDRGLGPGRGLAGLALQGLDLRRGGPLLGGEEGGHAGSAGLEPQGTGRDGQDKAADGAADDALPAEAGQGLGRVRQGGRRGRRRRRAHYADRHLRPLGAGVVAGVVAGALLGSVLLRPARPGLAVGLLGAADDLDDRGAQLLCRRAILGLGRARALVGRDLVCCDLGGRDLGGRLRRSLGRGRGRGRGRGEGRGRGLDRLVRSRLWSCLWGRLWGRLWGLGRLAARLGSGLGIGRAALWRAGQVRAPQAVHGADHEARDTVRARVVAAAAAGLVPRLGLARGRLRVRPEVRHQPVPRAAEGLHVVPVQLAQRVGLDLQLDRMVRLVRPRVARARVARAGVARGAIGRRRIGPFGQFALERLGILAGLQAPEPGDLGDAELMRPYFLFGHGRCDPLCALWFSKSYIRAGVNTILQVQTPSKRSGAGGPWLIILAADTVARAPRSGDGPGTPWAGTGIAGQSTRIP